MNKAASFMEKLAQPALTDGKTKDFVHPAFGLLRAFEIGNDIWFIGIQVAQLLEYKNGIRDVNRHVIERFRRVFSQTEIQKYQIGSFASPRGITMIKEPGFWMLASRSTMPKAQELMIWVYEDVLPSIRKTGSYSAQPSPAPVHQPIDDPFRYLKPILGEEMYNELTKRASKSVEPDILTFYGRRVWTLQMLADLYGMKKQTIYWTMKGNLFERPAEWFVTNHLQKRQLCVENKRYFAMNICLVTEKGFERLRQLMECRRLEPHKTAVRLEILMKRMENAPAELKSTLDLFDEI